MISKYTKRKTIHCNLMGIYTASAFVPEAAVVIHAPRSCSHILSSAIPALNERYQKSERVLPLELRNLYVTGLNDNEAIFGGEKKLERCLRDIAEECHPSYIMVASGCVAGVIGDDVESVCRQVEAETGVPILSIAGSGFMNDVENDPYIATTRLLVNKFTDLHKPEEREETVVVLGELSVNNRRFLMECIRRLFGYFEYTKVYFPLAGMKIAEFHHLNNVSLAIAGRGQLNKKREIHAYTREFSDILRIPFSLAELPETPAATTGWLEEIGVLIHKTHLIEKAVQAEKAVLSAAAAQCRPVLEKTKCILSFFYSYSYHPPETIIETIKGSGLQIAGFLLLPEMADVEKEKYREALKPYGRPVYLETDYLTDPPEHDFVISSTEKIYFKRQFILEGRRIGAAGIAAFWQQLKQFAESDRRTIYEK